MTDPRIHRVRRITPTEENLRAIPLGPNAVTTRRDPVEPEPVGTYVAMVFRVTGYDRDCDGSLMARLEHVGANGEATGWEVDCVGLHPTSAWVLDGPDGLDRVASDEHRAGWHGFCCGEQETT